MEFKTSSMPFLVGLLAVGFLSPALGELSVLECAHSTLVGNEQDRCFSPSFEEPLALQAFDLLPSVANYCSKPAAFKSAVHCAIDVAIACKKARGESTVVLRDADKLYQGMQYLCGHGEDIDRQCYTNIFHTLIHTCVGPTISSFHLNSRRDNETETTCKYFEIFAYCEKIFLSGCPKTRDIMVRYMENFASPPNCGLGNDTLAAILLSQLPGYVADPDPENDADPENAAVQLQLSPVFHLLVLLLGFNLLG